MDPLMTLRPLFTMLKQPKQIPVVDTSEPAELTVIDDPSIKKLLGVDPNSVYLTFVAF